MVVESGVNGERVGTLFNATITSSHSCTDAVGLVGQGRCALMVGHPDERYNRRQWGGGDKEGAEIYTDYRSPDRCEGRVMGWG